MVKKCVTATCVIISKGRTFLIKHKKLGVWLYPGGHVEENEYPSEAAVRETLEETGYKVRIIDQRPEGYIHINEAHDATEEPAPLMILSENVRYKTGMHKHFDLIYIAEPASKRKRIHEGESTEARWFYEKEVDRIDTFKNTKDVIHRAFEACRAGRS